MKLYKRRIRNRFGVLEDVEHFPTISYKEREYVVQGYRLGQLIKLNSREFARIVAHDVERGHWLAEMSNQPKDKPIYCVITEDFARERVQS